MKKFFIFITFLFIFLIPNSVFAAHEDPGGGGSAVNCTTPECVFGTINPPASIKSLVDKGGAEGISTVLSNMIDLIITVALILFIFMVLISALQWILSGGDKEKVAAARGRLTYAVIGVIILGLSWVIFTLIGNITGIKLPIQK